MTGAGSNLGDFDAPPLEPDEIKPFAQPLEHGRWRHFGWTVFWLALAALFIAAFSTTGIVLGVIFLALGAGPGLEFLRTLAHPPGAIHVDLASLRLPPRVCAGTEHLVEVPLAEVKRAYFVRRALPFMAHGPILVVETGRGSFQYPRDWFDSEADQEKVVDGINRRVRRPA